MGDLRIVREFLEHHISNKVSVNPIKYITLKKYQFQDKSKCIFQILRDSANTYYLPYSIVFIDLSSVWANTIYGITSTVSLQ